MCTGLPFAGSVLFINIFVYYNFIRDLGERGGQFSLLVV